MKTTSQKTQKAGAQSRPEQVSTKANAEIPKAPLPPIDRERRMHNRRLRTSQLLDLLRSEAPRFFELAEVVGKWVWIQFDDKQPSEITAALAELGFHWNNRRQIWQHPCGTSTVGTDKDPRDIYHCFFAADRKAA